MLLTTARELIRLSPDAPAAGSALQTPPAEAPAAPAAGGDAPPPDDAPPSEEAPSDDDPGISADDPDLRAAFDDLDNEVTAPRKKADDAPPPDKKPDEQPPAKAADKPEDKTKLKLDPNDARLPKGFRNAYGELSTELNATKAELDKIRAELAEAREAGDQRKIVTDETKALSDKIQEQEKTINGLRDEIGVLRFTESQEFKEKFEQPLNDAAEDAKAIVEGLEVIESSEDGVTQTRPASWDDFVSLFWLAKPATPEARANANAQIRKLFGGAAGEVRGLLNNLLRLDSKANAAREAERGQWQEKAKSAQANATVLQQKLSDAWDKVNADIRAKHPDWYGDAEGDDDGNALLAKGYEPVNHYFANRAKMKPEDVLIIEAQIANRAAAFPRMARRYSDAVEEIKELKARIEELEGSDPNNPTKRRTEGEQVQEDDGFFNQGELAATFE